MLEQHVGTDARMKLTGKPREEVTAERFNDSVGVGSYRIDLHPTTGGDNYIDVSSLPFQIPLGALIPRRVENLLAGREEPRRHPHHQRLLPAASGGVEHRRVRGRAGRALRHREAAPRAGAQHREAAARISGEIQAQGVELEWPKA